MGKKSEGKFKKVAFRKSPERVSKFRNSSQFREKSEVERPRKRNFFSKFWPPQGGGGVEISAKIAEIRFFGLLKFLKANSPQKAVFKFFWLILRNFSRNFPPSPLWGSSTKFWEEISFSGSFDLRFFSQLGRISELRHPFHGFFEKPLFRTFRNIFSPNSLNFLQKLEHFLQKLQTFSAIWWLDKRANVRP